LRGLIEQASHYANENAVPFKDLREIQNKRIALDPHMQDNPKVKAISEALCTVCKGGCCTSGRNKAYLSVMTIRRFMDIHPAFTAEDVLNSYLSLLSPSTIGNSCINQTKKGCGLPRDMRSDICNGYFCESIVVYHKHDGKTDKSHSVLAIQRANTNWNRLAADVDKQVLEQHLFLTENFN